MIYTISVVSELQNRVITLDKDHGSMEKNILKADQFLFCVSVLNQSSSEVYQT